MLLFGRHGVKRKLVVIIIYHGIYLVCATSHIGHILTSHILLVYATKVSSTLLTTFCEMERFAKGSSHENWQRIGNRAWYLRCSVLLSFVDEEVYDVMYRYMTWHQMTSALSDIQILSWICACCMHERVCTACNENETARRVVNYMPMPLLDYAIYWMSVLFNNMQYMNLLIIY